MDFLTNAFYCYLLFSSFFLSQHIQPSEARVLASNRTETDRLALLAIKSKLNDGPSHVLTSWNESVSFCKWRGVTCSPRHQRVMKLLLPSQGIVGTLSPHIGNLTFLRLLSLANNSFSGVIPPELGRLFRLQGLFLHNNSFVGNIPANISGCTNLQYLYLSGNVLEGKIPVHLGSLTKLVKLHLFACNLTGEIPSFIWNLSSLQSLVLTSNKLQGSISDSIGQLNNLTDLGLDSNLLSGTVPSSVYNISSLKVLYFNHNFDLKGNLPPDMRLPNLEAYSIGFNQFSGTIPVSLFNSSGLQILAMGSNNFIGRVPIEVGNLKRLQFLNLQSNSLGSGKMDDLHFLTTLTNCSDLYRLYININHFGGVLPNSIANLSNRLSYLSLGSNQIHGKIPSSIQKYVSLIGLWMYNNFFVGSIPFSIGMLQNLQKLVFADNMLSGHVPSSIANMSSLYIIDLSNNTLEGNILPFITNGQFLQIVDLSHNKFNGTIPEELINLSQQLAFLDLSYNSLVRSLPIQLGNFKNLRLLDVSENKMSGEIPNAIGGCVNLQYLILRGNFFQGPIPTSFKFLKEIRDLDLSKNNLSGKIPNDIGYLPLLQTLNLSYNNLEGVVPKERIFRNLSAFSILGNPKLCGGITELQLPACPIQSSNKAKISSTLQITLGVVLSSVIVAFFVFVSIYGRRRAKEKSALVETFPGDQFQRVSYRELHHATNGFSLTNLIGVGSVGSVYKGTLHEDARLVAVKVLNLLTRGAAKSFITECDALRKVRHRNLLKILTICSSLDFKGDDFKALVLEFMPNGNLEFFLHPSNDGRSRALSLLKRLNIAIDIASALDYLHNHCETPIIHCDLKPSNILLDEYMVAHVGDFGLAKFLPSSTSNFNVSESSSPSPKGTIGYIPPEYGSGRDVSTKGDVYSYGILLLEMFTGKRPTDGVFKDGLTLHRFCSMALPLRLMDIVDPHMPLEEESHGEDIINLANQTDITDRIQEYITSIVKVGVACSAEASSERTDISDVLMELHVIKEVFLGDRTQRQPQNTI